MYTCPVSVPRAKTFSEESCHCWKLVLRPTVSSAAKKGGGAANVPKGISCLAKSYFNFPRSQYISPIQCITGLKFDSIPLF